MNGAALPGEFLDFLASLARAEVRYVLVGGTAVIYHGHARTTGDMDVFYDRSPENVGALWAALLDFWGGAAIPALTDARELLDPSVVVQFGVPPVRIDLLSSIAGVRFDDAWGTRCDVVLIDGARRIPVHYIGLGALVANKSAAGRPKDLADLQFLERRLTAGDESAPRAEEPRRTRGRRGSDYVCIGSAALEVA